MSLHCPRCDVSFEKDLPRCPGCGWDFRAHIVPQGFLDPPVNFDPLREYPLFLWKNGLLIWVNGITVQIIWGLIGYLIFRFSVLTLRILSPENAGSPLNAYLAGLALVLSSILVLPIWANYLFDLLRRYRYHVPVAFFNVFVPGRSRYVQTMTWGLPCFFAGIVLHALLVVPGVICLWIFVPILLLIHLDKRGISDRRKAFILELAFRKLWLLLVVNGLILSVIWALVVFISVYSLWTGILIAAFLVPAQAAFAVLFYESILGRENLDVDT